MPAWMDVGEPGEVVDAAADRGPAAGGRIVVRSGSRRFFASERRTWRREPRRRRAGAALGARARRAGAG
jgi:hypothetical protein